MPPPFFRFPYPYRIYQPRYPSPYIKPNQTLESNTESKYKELQNVQPPSNKKELNEPKNDFSQNVFSNLFSFIPTSIGPLNFHPEALSDNTLPLFELFGIHLFLDDLIIICILIFLYQEGVTDQILYISLFLLLFS